VNIITTSNNIIKVGWEDPADINIKKGVLELVAAPGIRVNKEGLVVLKEVLAADLAGIMAEEVVVDLGGQVDNKEDLEAQAVVGWEEEGPEGDSSVNNFVFKY
jgi:hypothetical protein